MRHAAYLSWRYLRSAPGRSAVLVFGLAVALFLPVFSRLAVAHLETALVARAEASPILLGRRGDAFDLTLASLYFRGQAPEPVPFRLVEKVEIPGYGLAIPLHVAHSSDGAPIVGTVPEYAEVRGLGPAAGRLPVMLGEVAAGSELARKAGLEVGDRVRSDLSNLYDLAGAYPLLLEVVGVLEPTHGPDDRVFFTSLETAWALDGLFHGHEEVTEAQAVSAPGPAESGDSGPGDGDLGDGDPGDEETENLEASAALFLFAEIDERNRASFHLHGDRGEAPVTSILVLPESRPAHDHLLGDLALDERYQAVRPLEVVRTLLELVFRVRAAVEAYLALVAASTFAFVALVILLSLRLRRDELHLLRRLGAGRASLAALVGVEILLLTLAAAVLAALTTWAGLTALGAYL
ncbi:MAG: hypothetical protein MI919_02400 [Holophagales bacterium]|nr:hypothetical protein [Holophagales bacterium]